QWGVVLENGAVDTVIQHNTLTDSTEDGIALNYMGQYGLPRPTGTRIENNTLTRNKVGVADYASDATVIVGNQISGGAVGILAAPYDDGIDKLTIEGNRITDVTAQAISLVQPEDGPGDMAMTAHIEGNTIERAG